MKELTSVEVSAVVGAEGPYIGGHAIGLIDAVEGAAVLGALGATYGGLVGGSNAGTGGAGGVVGAGIIAQGVGALAGIIAAGATGLILGAIQGYSSQESQNLADDIFTSINNGDYWGPKGALVTV
ncbi:hypothetical protein [Carnimonas bestiolae]|uniref:hypothetical protein n=1 Tax=Carnimonas bestiolae TaxID=3402172 RepID=UPI003EDBAA04